MTVPIFPNLQSIGNGGNSKREAKANAIIAFLAHLNKRKEVGLFVPNVVNVHLFASPSIVQLTRSKLSYERWLSFCLRLESNPSVSCPIGALSSHGISTRSRLRLIDLFSIALICQFRLDMDLNRNEYLLTTKLISKLRIKKVESLIGTLERICHVRVITCT